MFELKRNDIIQQLDILSMVPPKLGIPSSEYFWVRSVKHKPYKILLSAASYIGGEIILKGKGKWPFASDFYLDRRMFVPFILAARELKDKHTFQFEKKGKQLIVRHGSRKVAFDSQPNIKGYGNATHILHRAENAIPLNEDLKDMLICGKNCAVSDSVVPHLNAVYLAKSSSGIAVKLYAASDKVLYMGSGKLTEGKVTASIPFPLYLINLLEAEGLKKIICAGKYIILQFNQGLIWQPISQEAIKHFPLKKIQSHAKIGETKKVTFVASSRRFSRLMLRLGYYLQSVRRKDWVVSIKGKKGNTYVDVTTSIAGAKFYERIGTSDKLLKDFAIEWPLNIMEPVFGYLSKKTKKLGVTVRVDEKHGVSYITVGNYWLAVPSRQES